MPAGSGPNASTVTRTALLSTVRRQVPTMCPSTTTVDRKTPLPPGTIRCAADLRGAAAGLWNVVVINPNGEYWTLTNGFSPTPFPNLLIFAANGQAPVPGDFEDCLQVTEQTQLLRQVDQGYCLLLPTGGSQSTAPDKQVTATFSLSGFTAGFEALQKTQ